MNKQSKLTIILTIWRAVICFLLVSFASAISHYFIFEIFSTMIEDGMIPAAVVFLYSAAVYLLAFFMLVRIFAEYHAPFRQNFPPCRRNTNASPKEKISLLFQNPSFLISLAVTVIFLPLFPSITIAKYVAGIFYDSQTIFPIALLCLPVMSVLFSFAYLSAAKNIRTEGIREKQKHADTPIRSFLWATLNQFLTVVCGSILLPILILAASQFLIFLIFLPLVLVAILAFWALRYLRAIRIRAKFLHSLKETCRKNRYYLSKIKKPYLSLFFATEGMSFSIKDKNGKQYDCKLLHSIKRTAPMFFHNDGYATLVSPVSFFKAELFYRVKTLPYGFESENSKCVIVCPIPRAVYARNDSSDSDVDSAVTESKFIFAGIGGTRMGLGGLHEMELPKNARSRVMDIGDSFNGYKFFNATAFLNAINFNVFDK